MNKFLSTAIVIFFISLQTNGQNFTKKWQKVYKLEIEGKTKSALKEVEAIHKIALQKKNDIQQIKSFIYISNFKNDLVENAEINFFTNILNEIKISSEVGKAFLYQYYAVQLVDHYEDDYYIKHRAKMTDRNSTNIEIWDEEKFETEIQNSFEKSYSNKTILSALKVVDFPELITKVDAYFFDPNKNLYQFFIENYINTMTKTYDYEYYENAIYNSKPFSNSKTFSQTDFSFLKNEKTRKIIRLYQLLEETNMEDVSIFTLNRVKFLYSHCINKQEIWKDIVALKEQFDNSKLANEFNLFYSETLIELANKKENIENNSKALSILNKLTLMGKSNPKIYTDAFNLKETLLEKELNVVIKDEVYPNENIRAFLTYKNIDTISVSYYKIKSDELNYFKNDSLVLEYMNSHQAKKSYFKTLVKKNDYFEYTTEILLEPFDSGNYLVVLGTPKNNGNFSFTYNILKCNSLDYFRNIDNDVVYYNFRDRKTGKPISNVIIRTKEKTYMADSTGKFAINQPSRKDENHHSYPITLIHEKDTLATSIPCKYEYSKKELNYDTFDSKAYLYSDRAIYRPGQKMFYKGIVTQVKNYQSSVVPFVTVLVEIKNPIGEIVKTFEVQTNEFGSFSGEFDIPNNGITGRYLINIDEPENYEQDSKYYNEKEEEHSFWDNTYFESDYFLFQVEEYKRPTFEVSMDKITTDWKLGDTIILKGKATGLAGNTISDAEVKAVISCTYRDISDGIRNKKEDYITKTKTDGTFEIEIPTKELSTNNGEFNYSFYVTTKVIDINGETRNTRQNVVISNKSLVLDMKLPYQILKENKNEITIEAKTLNDVEKQVVGKLNIYKIQKKESIFDEPSRKPEIQTIDSLTLAKLFPHLIYYNDEDTSKRELIKTIDFDTKTKNKFNLDFLDIGNYFFEAIAYDDQNNKINDSQTIKIETKLPNKPNNKLFSYFVNTNEKSNQIEVIIKSKIDDLFVTCFEYDENEKIAKEHLIQLQNGDGKIMLPKPKNRLGLYFFSFYENHFHSDEHTSYYNAEVNKLKFEIISMRNKIEPGSTENWQFKILNSKLEAEILASMYDISLDDFASLNWKLFRKEENSINFPYFYKNSDNIEFDFMNNDSKKINFEFKTTNMLNWFYDEDLESRIEKNKKKSNNFIIGNVQAKDEIPTEIFIANRNNRKYTFTDFYGNFSIEGKPNDILEIDTENEFYLLSTKQKNITIHLGKIKSDQKDIALLSNFEVHKSNPIQISNKNKVIFESNHGTRKKVSSIYKTTKGYTLSGSAYDKFMYENYYSLGSDKDPLEMHLKMVDTVSVANEYIEYMKKSDDGETVYASNNSEEILDSDSVTGAGRVTGVSIANNNGYNIKQSIVKLRGSDSIYSENELLYVVDGVPVNYDTFKNLNPDDLASLDVLKDASASQFYGNRGANGVVIISTKKAMQELTTVKTRKNFNETAFFKPHIKTDREGKFTLEFTTPESLTTWRLNLFAHNKLSENGKFTSEIVAQKDLMLIPNMPRFVRENDELVVTAKISNLLNEIKTGIAKLSLFDAGTGNPINALVETKEIQNFNCLPKGSTVVQWKIKVPKDIQGLQYKIVAKAGNFSDGEENILPVLKNAILITESQPIWLNTKDTKSVTFEALTNKSETKENHKISINLVTNPIWSVIESLPYLMEYEHDCAEQTFSKLFANSISEKIINDNPKIKLLLEDWKKNPTSKLKMNEDLKSVLLSETPWLVENNDELQKRISSLLEVTKLKTTNDNLFQKLKEKQSSNGGFSWFGVGNENEYITRHILSGIGHLTKLNPENETKYKDIVAKGIRYLDSKFETSKAKREVQTDLHYLYARSFFLTAHPLSKKQDSILKLQLVDFKKNWLQQSLYEKTILALVLHRFDDKNFAKKIIEHIRESTVLDETKGMFWKENTNGYYWYQSNIELQALLIETFAEIDYKTNEVEAMKVWLINNKQNKNWNTTKSSALAINAIISYGKDWINSESKIQINDGKNKAIQQELNSKLKETENGLINLEIKKEELSKNFTSVKLENKGITPIYGGVYYQYFENLDKIIATTKTDYSISKELVKDDKVVKNENLKVGDLVTIRLTFKTEKDLEFVHVKDLRASCFEPVNVISETKWINNTYYYMSTKDIASHFFFDNLPKGTYVVEYKVRVNNEGVFSDGYANMQSMYAPEFSAHSTSGTIKIVK